MGYPVMKTTPESVSRVRVILADDNKIIREKVIMLLEPEFEVVGAVADGQALLEAVPNFDPDVGVIDISMPRIGGIEAVRKLKGTGCRMLVVYLTVHEDPDFARAAFEGGASAYVVKSRMVSDLIPAIRAATHGRFFVSPCFALEDNPLPVSER
jgi:DNA-binding NarL/FixJ family response regulator